MNIPELEWLAITGDISVEPVSTRLPDHLKPCLYLIMGPTGAGKSSFIEALAGESQKLSISKDQLAGYTQTVTTYRLVNVVHKGSVPPHPVYLIDTPGFSDSKISEIEIMEMLRQWSLENNLDYFVRILYLIPITATRLPGSRHRTFKMLKQFMEEHPSYSSMIIITTMWDTVHNEQSRERAESNFAQLRNETLKEFVRRPSTGVIQYMNNRSSALQALDQRFSLSMHMKSRDTPQHPYLYLDLHERIQVALHEKQIMELDLAQPEVQTNAELRTILKRNQRENHETLTKFIDQFSNFREFPPEYRDATHRLRKSIAANARPANIKYRVLFWKWAREPEPVDDIESDDHVDVSQPLVLKDFGHFAVDASKRSVAKVFKRGE